jgi:murein DD-endopeptidase MepM/ murein hydrolase activator NlpD
MRRILKFISTFISVLFVLFISNIKISNALDLNLKLPFLSNEKWAISQGYNCDGWDSPKCTHKSSSKDGYAIDFSLPQETDYNKPILAISSGIVSIHEQKIFDKVTNKFTFIGYGKYIDINHGNGLISRYAHLLNFLVNDNEYVTQGQEIGRADNTGASSGTHLHFAMYREEETQKTDANGRIYTTKILAAYKPEPMSGYTNFLAGNWYESDNRLVEAEKQNPIVENNSNTNQNTQNQPTTFWSRLISNIQSGVNYLSENFTRVTKAIYGEQTKPKNNYTIIDPAAAPPATPKIYTAEWQSQSGDDVLKPGEETTLWVKIKNTGNQIWEQGKISLNIDLNKNSDAALFYNPAWITAKRPAKLDQIEVKPGEIGSFTFQIIAPAEEKIYTPYFRPVYQDNNVFNWLGSDMGIHWTVTVKKDVVLDQGGALPETNPIVNEPATNPDINTENLEIPATPTVASETPIEDQTPPDNNPEIPTETTPPTLVEIIQETPLSISDPPYVPPVRGLPDTTPPDTIIDSSPTNPTAALDASFSFHATENNCAFQCELDGGGFNSCQSPYSISNLAEGEHTFQVKARDQANNFDLAPASSVWTIDNTPPPQANLTLSDPVTGSNTFTKNQTINLEITDDGDATAWLISEIQTTKPAADNSDWQIVKPTSLNLSAGDAAKTVYLWAKDILNNITENASTATIIFDTTPPSSQISSLNNLTASLSFSVNWSGTDNLSDIKSYDVQSRDGAAGDWQDWLTGVTDTNANFTGLENHTYYFRIKATDSLDNAEDWPADPNGDDSTIISFSRRVVINEIAWMGTQASANDEFIELYNTTGQNINLTGWTLQAVDGAPSISLTGSIEPYNFFLLERTADTTVNNIIASQIYTGALSNAGEDMELRDSGGDIIDQVNAATDGGWYAGDNTTKNTMERIDQNISGNISTNWKTNDGITIYGKDAANNTIKGTPKNTNHAITTLGNITSDTTLTALNSPYKLINKVTVAAGIILTIEPGVVVKASQDGILEVNGTLTIPGTEEKPVIFTSLKDDSYGGDTNYNFNATNPAGGDWPWIIFNALSQNSNLNNLIVRYGGYYWFEGHQDGEIRVEGSTVNMTNLTVEYGHVFGRGIYLLNAGASTIDNCLIQNQYTSIKIEGGAPTISNCIIKNNKYALAITANSEATISSNQFLNNNDPFFVNEAPVNVENSYPILENNSASSNDFNGIKIRWASPMNRDYTLKADLPYTLYNSSVAAGSTLTIEAGVIFKQSADSILSVDGTLIAEGTSDAPIVFTSMKDDTLGGDTNNDGGAGLPVGGDWPWIVLNSSSQNSIFNHLIVRYGGYYWLHGETDGEIRIENTNATIENTLIELSKDYPAAYGLHLKNSDSTINNSIFQNQFTGLWIEGGSPQINNSSFINNKLGILATAGATPIINSPIFEGNEVDTSPPDLLP